MKKTLLIASLFFSLQLSAQNQATFYTTMGNFVVEMYNGRMPVTTTNFEGLVTAKFYDSITFHRVIANFMNQGGDPATRGGAPSAVIQDEFDATTSNVQYTISMANAGPNTGTSQFFINVKDNTFLDFDKAPPTSAHPVFGEVTSGFSVVDAINAVQTDGNDRPLIDVRMDSVRMTYITPLSINNVEIAPAIAQVSPNPIDLDGSLNIVLSKQLEATIIITDIEGKELFLEELQLVEGSNKISLSEFNIMTPGIYFIQILGEPYSSTWKLLVK